jgi:transcriptional regulator with XRE-family HTH domain
MMLVVEPKAFRRRRELRLLSRAELSGRCGITSATVGRIERGEPVLRSTLRKCLAELGLEIDDALSQGVIREVDDGQD